MHRSARRLLATSFRLVTSPCSCRGPLNLPFALPPPAVRDAARLPAARAYSSKASPSSSSDSNPELSLLKRAASNVLRRGAPAEAVGAEEDAAGEAAVEQAKRDKELEPVRRALREVEEAEELIGTLQDLATSESDPDLRSLALEDVAPAQSALSASLSSLKSRLLPPSPESSLSALLEFKPGVGGSESTLFCAEMVRMYQRLAARKGWKAAVVEAVGVEGMGTGQAYKEALLEVTGEGAFGYLRREAGVHRVQRVPETESKGRVHTSTVAVLVLPAESAGQQVDASDLYELKDVKVETMRSRGAGGQHVNRTESAIRLTHLPTGVTVSMQDSRSQHENRTKAFRVLTSRLLALRLSAAEADRRSARRGQVSGTDRSDKVRTYSFSQGRITDHRIGLTLTAVEDALQGGESLDLINEGLERREEEERVGELLGEE
ncbi:hypothetical protein JCM8097_001659 [Rhodosporidiobolus ruineniae]